MGEGNEKGPKKYPPPPPPAPRRVLDTLDQQLTFFSSHHAMQRTFHFQNGGYRTLGNMTARSRHDVGELESQFILRLPKVQAASLRHTIQNGTLKERLSIELQADYRHATVRFDGAVLAGKVLDLPCIIESHKTVDRKSFYKTADVCRMLVCQDEDEADEGQKEEDSIFQKKESKKFMWNHGITPPLKNVRKRRFRKTAKKKVTESPEIEKEVKRLLRTDLSADSVTFEVIQDEEKPEDGQDLIVSDGEQGVPSPLTMMRETETKTTQDGSSEEEDRNELLAILQEASSDEEEDEGGTQEEKDEEDFDIDIEAYENVDNQKASINLNEVKDVALKDRFESARQRLDTIRVAKAEQEMRVNEAANPFLKQRFEKILEELKNQERKQELLLSECQ